MAKPCKWCNSTMHSSTFCLLAPRKPIKSKRKFINRRGPVAAKWNETRLDWIQKNATPSNTWECAYCGKLLAVEAIPEMDIEILTLDHVKPKSKHHDLRYNQDNLVPACWKCNEDKGTKELEEFISWLEANQVA